MNAVAGLGNANLRLVPNDLEEEQLPEIMVEMEDDPKDIPEVDESGNILKIVHGDGSVSVSLDGQGLGKIGVDEEPLDWYGNLAERIDEEELSRICEELLQGIADDLQSRREWIEDRAHGMKLLGLKIELPNTQGASDGAPVEGMSKVRHPLLLEAVLRFQANARSELLPTDGPVKIRNDSNDATVQLDELANALERDFNHFLTVVATEYYPDTDRMLFMTGFGGDGFKKVYFCPLRNRPVSESVDADDLIVNQSATDIANASRVTHKTMIKQSTVKRLQIMGVYRDIDLGDPMMVEMDALEEAEKAQQGIRDNSMQRPQNRERLIYECYCELNIKGFEHKIDGKETGLAIPYVVTIDKSDRKVFAVTRNFHELDERLPTAHKRFVKFPFVPGIGFYGIGLLHILGNTTNAATAAWREMLDNGMFANFPGFLIAKSGTRQNTNVFRVPPGGGASIDTQGMPIGQAVAPLPYESAHMGPMMQLVDNMVETGRRIGGTAEVQVGEGRADVPVGTTMAMIDQAVKVMNAVHKRMHAAQAEEFQLLKQVFRDHPESFYARPCKSKTVWDKEKFLAALNNCDLVPQADPNTSSSGQRLMKIMALKQLQAASPNLYDPIKVDTAALTAIGWPNAEEFFVPPAARAAPPPQLQQLQSEMKNEKDKASAQVAEAGAKVKEAQAKQAEVQAKIAAGHYGPKKEGLAAGASQETESPIDVALAQAKILDSQTRARDVALKEHLASVEDRNRDQDRQAKERDTAIRLASDVIRAPTNDAGEPTSLAGAGDKANEIIKEVDRGVNSE